MTENISQYVKSIVHDTRNSVNDGMKCVGKGLWHEDCIIHYRKTAKTAFLALLPNRVMQGMLFLPLSWHEWIKKLVFFQPIDHMVFILIYF